jgi:ribonuclease HI
MTEFLSLGLTSNQLRLVNNWRIVFQVTTLTELCNTEGNKIRECFIKAPLRRFINKANKSTLLWSNQGIPGKRGFCLWLKCLRSSFNMSNKGHINYQLGKWQSSDILTKQNCSNHYVQMSTGSLFTMSNGTYYHIPCESRKKTSTTHKNIRNHCQSTHDLPGNCIPISLRFSPKRNILIATVSSSTSPERIIIKDTPHRTNRFIENTIVTDAIKFRQLFSQEDLTIYVASDGGVHNYEGTFGVIMSDGSSPFAKNHEKFYSVDFCESLCRSELFAMLAGILSFKSLCYLAEVRSTTKFKFKIFSDSRILVNKINNRLSNRRTTNQHRDSDVDLELQIISELTLLMSKNYQISIGFVCSHQELKKLKSDLSHIELLNIMADKLTKSARKLKRKGKYTSLPQNPIDFTINNITINSKYSLRSKKAYHSIYLREYYKQEYLWPNNIIDSIWWKPYYNSLAKLSFPEKVLVYKFINDRLPTKAREHKYYSFETNYAINVNVIMKMKIIS